MTDTTVSNSSSQDKTLASPPSTAATESTPRLVYMFVGFAVIAWGGSFVAARVLLYPSPAGAVTLSPTVLAAARFSLASVFFLVPLGRAVLQRRVSFADLLRLAALGLLAYTAYFWLQYTGVQHTSASLSSILVVGLIPLATALLASLLGAGPLTRAELSALLLGFLGVVVVALQQGLAGFGARRDANFGLGVGCLIGNALVFALYSILAKRWLRGISPLVLTGATMLSGALGLILLSFADSASNHWSDIGQLSGVQLVMLLFLVLICSVAAYFAYNFALSRMPADRAATFVYFEPVVAVALGTLLLGEQLSGQSILGALLITASVLMLHLLRRVPTRRRLP